MCVELCKTDSGMYIFVRSRFRTSVKPTIQEAVEEYITIGCAYSFRAIRMPTTPILTLKPRDIKTLHITNPELFL